MGKYTRQDGMLMMAIGMVNQLIYFGCLTESESHLIKDVLNTARSRVGYSETDDIQENIEEASE